MDLAGKLLEEGFLRGSKREKEDTEALLWKLVRSFDRIFTPETAWHWLEASYRPRPNRTNLGQSGSAKLFGYGLIDWAGLDGHRAKKFFSQLLKALCYAPKPLRYDDRPSRVVLPPLLTCFASLVISSQKDLPLAPGLPDRAATLILKEAARDEEAREILSGIVLLLTSYGYELREKGLGAQRGLKAALASLGEKWKSLTRRTDVLQLSLLVAKKQAEIEVFCERLWSEIVSRGRCDVRPDGLDAYIVKDVLGEIAGKYRYFIREGCDFPEVDTVVLMPWFGGEAFEIIRLSAASFIHSQKLSNLAVADFLVNSVVYHRIVCHEPEERTRPRLERPDASAETVLETARLIREQVRMHLRRLRPGWLPSEEKKQEARERFGRELPDGYTLVSDFERGRRVTSNMAAEETQQTLKRHPELPSPSFIVDPLRVLESL